MTSNERERRENMGLWWYDSCNTLRTRSDHLLLSSVPRLCLVGSIQEELIGRTVKVHTLPPVGWGQLGGCVEARRMVGSSLAELTECLSTFYYSQVTKFGDSKPHQTKWGLD